MTGSCTERPTGRFQRSTHQPHNTNVSLDVVLTICDSDIHVDRLFFLLAFSEPLRVVGEDVVGDRRDSTSRSTWVVGLSEHGYPGGPTIEDGTFRPLSTRVSRSRSELPRNEKVRYNLNLQTTIVHHVWFYWVKEMMGGLFTM